MQNVAWEYFADLLPVVEQMAVALEQFGVHDVACNYEHVRVRREVYLCSWCRAVARHWHGQEGDVR